MADTNQYVVRQDIREIFKTQGENVVYTSGVDNEHKEEVTPELETTTAEKYIKGHSNSIIVLGKDRHAGISSGNGGKGKTGAAAIDIVVGLMGARPLQKIAGGTVKCQKDFHNDAARIYVSQMTDLDEYFKIPKLQAIFLRSTAPSIQTKEKAHFLSAPLENVKNTSGVGIKADHVRIIARENIKLVTNHAGVNSISNSVTKDGISLIAGYDMMHDNPSLQLEPMVKGNKLIKFLEILINCIQNVNSVLSSFMNQQNQFNMSLYSHTHVCSAPGNVSYSMSGADSSAMSIINHQIKTIPDDIYVQIKNELLKQYLHSASKDFILSRWHKLN